MKTISREYRIYLALWRKAYRQRNDAMAPEVAVTASNRNLAISMRQGMYRALAPYRSGERFDEELRQAGELFVATLEKREDPLEQHRVIFRPRATLSELEKELEALGLSEADLQIDGEVPLSTSLSEFLSQEDVTIGRATPFYKRD